MSHYNYAQYFAVLKFFSAAPTIRQKLSCNPTKSRVFWQKENFSLLIISEKPSLTKLISLSVTQMELSHGVKWTIVLIVLTIIKVQFPISLGKTPSLLFCQTLQFLNLIQSRLKRFMVHLITKKWGSLVWALGKPLSSWTIK